MIMRTLGFIAFVFLLASGGISAAPITLEGRVVSVHDGDTITLLGKDLRSHRIRLAGIDAPEIGHGRDNPAQPFGQASKQSLAELAFGKQASAACPQADRYGRLLCVLYVDHRNINVEQIRRGMAWAYEQYAIDPTYHLAQAEAKSYRRGLWRDADPTPPWTYRQLKAQ